MKVTTVSASIRMSRQLQADTWATVELGAEATVDPTVAWTGEQASLYLQLKDQLKLLWKESQQDQVQVNGREVDTSTGEISTVPTCPTHHQSRPSDKFDGFYCSVKLDSGKWCPWKTDAAGSRRK